MESKPNKKIRNQVDKSDVDRLSSLPDGVLSHILQFLDTNTSVRTSVLSKRYRSLWTFSPVIDLKLLSFLPRLAACYPTIKNRKDNIVDPFKSYVNHIMQCREPSNLTMFRLSLHSELESEFIENCIDYASRHRVKHLRLKIFTRHKPVTLQRLLLDSPYLKILHLTNVIKSSIELPKSLSLPNLTVLRLKKFEFGERNYTGEIFSGCPNLETLVLSKCWIKPGDKIKILNVKCSNLKNLEVKYWRSPCKCYDEFMICVNAPRLRFFKFKGHLVKMNFNEVMPCLDEAWIDSSYPSSCMLVDVSERMRNMSGILIAMLRQICNVKVLSLSRKTLEVISSVPDIREQTACVFENLRFIKLTAEEKYTETTIPVGTFMQLLKTSIGDTLFFDVSKKDNFLLKRYKIKPTPLVNASPISIPAQAMHFLLESSPSAEFISIEIPKVSPDQK